MPLRSRFVLQVVGAVAVSRSLLGSAPELPSDIALVSLHNGINTVDLGGPATAGLVMLAHRENFNAHSFEFATFYLKTAAVDSDPEAWQLIPFEWKREEDIEPNYLRVSGGADCQLETFRLLRGQKDRDVYVLTAHRAFGHSFDEPGPVTFTWFKLAWNVEGLPGLPTASFQPCKTETTKKPYCDVDKAIEMELHLKGAIMPTEGSLPDQPSEAKGS